MILLVAHQKGGVGKSTLALRSPILPVSAYRAEAEVQLLVQEIMKWR